MRGIYVLIISVNNPITVKVGALGNLFFQEGFYAYVGSAQNNLELRVKRHLKRNKKKFWHIDYLLTEKTAAVKQVLFTDGDKKQECQIANLINQKAIAINGFGCSDCKCTAHLFYGKNFNFLNETMHTIKI